MNRCKPTTVTYCARSYFRSGTVDWYLTFHWGRAKWHWTKDAKHQRSFDDYGELIDAIVEAGGPDRNPRTGTGRGRRCVIIETLTREEQDITPNDAYLRKLAAAEQPKMPETEVL